MSSGLGSDPLRAVFSEQALRRLAAIRNPTPALKQRLRILNASGPYPVDLSDAMDVDNYRRRRAAWDAYLIAAEAVALLDADLERRLTGRNDDTFRAAIAECMAAWVVAGKMRLPVRARPPGNKGSILEFEITHSSGRINCEVKAPFREPLTSDGAFAQWDGDSEALAATINEAARQFRKGEQNLLIVVPSLMMPLRRRTIVHAFLGQEKIQLLIDKRTGRAVGGPRTKFIPDGRLARLHGVELKPRFTRIGAVMVAKEVDRIIGTNEIGYSFMIDHDIVVVHNPYSEVPISEELFGAYPQLVRGVGDEMIWTDTGNSRVDG